MSTLTSGASSPHGSSKSWIKVVAMTLLLAVVAFFLSPNAPFGAFWAPGPDVPVPTAGQLPFFILLNIGEALAFGLGISFLLFGYPAVHALSPASALLTRATHLSIVWLLANWWPHDSLHLHNGLALGGLLAIEYIFHVTLILAGVILAYFFLTMQRQSATASSGGR